MLCTERSLVKHQGSTLSVTPLRCRCWSCEHCAPWRAKGLRREAMQGSPTIFLTLTIRTGRYATPDRQAVELAKGWRMLRQHLCRVLNRKSIPFMAVIERHKSGWPHMHLLLRTEYISHKLIRDWWEARFASHVIWINRLTSEKRAAAYVTKYLAKAPTAFEGCKRYWSSRDYRLAKADLDKAPPEDDVWYEALTVTPTGLAWAAVHSGARVTFDGRRWLIEHWDAVERRRWGLR